MFAFLVVPLVVALGGRNGRQFEGSLLSIGAINFGLFLLVFCLGHVGYLTYYSTWMAFYLVTAVGLCDLFAYITGSRDRTGLSGFALQMLAPAVVTVFVAVILMPWTRLALVHTIALGLAIPILVAAGAFTITHIEADLRIDRDRLPPGRGRILNSLKSFFFTGPVVFHYLRHFLDEF